MDETQQAPKSGPALSADVQEVQGRFPNDAALQDALGRLTLLGFDHADFSLPDPYASGATPDSGAAAATDDIDKTQLRTMASSMGSASAASLVAGAMVATGVGAPLVVAAAAATALGTAAAATGAGKVVDQADVAQRDRLGAAGKLILAVRTRTQEKAQEAAEAMRAAGAHAVDAVTRTEDALTKGVSASSWTG